MPLDIDSQAYVLTLPLVQTSRLPVGTMFWAKEKLYQVIETGAKGFHKARQWRQGEETEAALVPGSYLANFLPVIDRGRLLPIYPNRQELLEQGQAVHYLFANERLALDAAYLDVALVQGGGVYVRNHGREPAFAATDGAHIFRLYYYSRSVRGNLVDAGAARQTLQFRMSVHGPEYWRLLDSWDETAFWSDDTIQRMPPVNPEDGTLI